MLVVETEGSLKQLDEKAERDQPYNAAKREYQPHRHLGKKQRYDGADQRALGEAEMIVDHEVDVGDVGFAGDLVEKNPDHNGDVDGEHQAPGIFPHTQIHLAPGRASQMRAITWQMHGAQRAIIFAGTTA